MHADVSVYIYTLYKLNARTDVSQFDPRSDRIEHDVDRVTSILSDPTNQLDVPVDLTHLEEGHIDSERAMLHDVFEVGIVR